MFKRLFSAAVIFGLAGTAPPMAAQAQTAPAACAPREAIVERLAERYSETRSGAGLQNASQMLEIHSSAETGSWTVLITRADGLSCIVATGTNWFDAPPTMAHMGVPG